MTIDARAHLALPRSDLARASAAADPGVRWVWGLLGARSILAIGSQAVIAFGALLAGSADPWRTAADWWLGWFVAVNLLTIWLLNRALAREGRSLRELFAVHGAKLRGDLPWLAVALLVAGPIAIVPNLLLGQVLWGSSQVGADLSFRALPVVAAVAILLTFPLVQAAAELPTYFGYVMPRLRAMYGWRRRAVIVTALFLSTQHVFLPFLLDWRFLAWRALMFLGFAIWIGFVIDRRPSTLPYLAVAHGLLDLSLPLLVLSAST